METRIQFDNAHRTFSQAVESLGQLQGQLKAVKEMTQQAEQTLIDMGLPLDTIDAQIAEKEAQLVKVEGELEVAIEELAVALNQYGQEWAGDSWIPISMG